MACAEESVEKRMIATKPTGRESEGRDADLNLLPRRWVAAVPGAKAFLEKKKALEDAHGVKLTGSWTMTDLNDLEKTLALVKNEKFTVKNPKFQTIHLEKLPPGVGGYNYGNGLIKIRPGKVAQVLLHEIGHDFDEENPKWGEFKKISGWKDVSNLFTGIGSDYDSTGAYRPYDGTAVFEKDGKMIRDGEAVDLDSDGDRDGVVEVYSGKVFIHDENASFISPYAHTNPKEDFAETFESFFLNPQKLKTQCPAKFSFMVDLAGYDPTVAGVAKLLIRA